MGQTITLEASDGHALSAYRADPTGKPVGGLIVIQEIFGVNDHIKSIAEKFAKEGYLAVAPALMDRAQRGVDIGYTQPDIEIGKEIRAKVKNDDSIKDLKAALDYLKAQGVGRIGVVGYCWGGSLAWLAATRIDGIAASVSYYGGDVATFADEKAKCPVMFHFGEMDKSIPMEKVEIVKQKQPSHPLYVYPAGHGFSCDARGSYDAKCAAEAFERTRAHLKRNLAG